MQTIIALLLSLLPQTAIEVTPCEVCELNHVMRPAELEWEERFTQLIWWGDYGDGCYVRQWAMVHEGELEIDKGLIVFRGQVFKADVLCESWTSEDVEMRDRVRKAYDDRVPVK